MMEEQMPYDPRDLDWPFFGSICGPGPSHYRVYLHRRGAKKWLPVAGRFETQYGAVTEMARAFETDHHYPEVNRAVVLMVENEPSYYDPIQICELRR